MSPHYAPTQPDYALTPANYSPSSPSYSLSGNYTPAVPDLPPSLPRGGSALVLGSDDDLNFQQTANITHQGFSYQVTNNCASELAVSFKTEDSVIFVEIPEVHVDGVVGENSCNITKLAELHDVSITRADSEEAGRRILMKLQGSSIDTQRAQEEILKLIEFQELFGSLMAGKSCN
ncbi:hypothetical protein BD410DRAFT_492187 [Rickenella mellea]|uniref:K Homology domain-containing protein n=1 Tax=Rickenella mellea TaxID=50990 RepID=A0A4Y7PUC4_9AGAM|nr:hypothetical protein BD410DRAFT_492187 [Rickenella mellea]